MSYDKEYLDNVDKEKLLNAIHAAVSLTYINTEEARLRARAALKEAAGWMMEHEREQIENRLKELEDAKASST